MVLTWSPLYIFYVGSVNFYDGYTCYPNSDIFLLFLLKLRHFLYIVPYSMLYHVVVIFEWLLPIFRNQAGDQDVQLLNDRQIVAKFSNPKNAQSGKPVDQGKCSTIIRLGCFCKGVGHSIDTEITLKSMILNMYVKYHYLGPVSQNWKYREIIFSMIFFNDFLIHVLCHICKIWHWLLSTSDVISICPNYCLILQYFDTMTSFPLTLYFLDCSHASYHKCSWSTSKTQTPLRLHQCSGLVDTEGTTCIPSLLYSLHCLHTLYSSQYCLSTVCLPLPISMFHSW